MNDKLSTIDVRRLINQIRDAFSELEGHLLFDDVHLTMEQAKILAEQQVSLLWRANPKALITFNGIRYLLEHKKQLIVDIAAMLVIDGKAEVEVYLTLEQPVQYITFTAKISETE